MAARKLEAPALSRDALVVRDIWIKSTNLFAKSRGLGFRYTPSAKHDGGYDADTRRNYRVSIWESIARHIAAVGLQPIDVIPSLFYWWTGVNPPQPRDCLTQGHTTACQLEVEARTQRVRTLLEYETARLATELYKCDISYGMHDRNTALAFLAGSAYRGLSPLHRFTIAWQIGREDLATRLAPEAVDQYSESPALYLEHWSSILTPKLVEIMVTLVSKVK